MDAFKIKLKEQIIEQLNLEDIKPEDIDNSASLFADDNLGLDSIDALEFIVLLDQFYGIKITDPSEGKEIFHSVDSLSAYIQAQK
jgi:acyl carrier protein